MAIRILRRDPYAGTIDMECSNAHCRKPVCLGAARVRRLVTDGLDLVTLECPACAHRFDVCLKDLDGPIGVR